MEKLYIAFPSANKNTVLNIVVFMPHDKENLRGMIQICTIMKAAKRCLKKSRGIWTPD